MKDIIMASTEDMVGLYVSLDQERGNGASGNVFNGKYEDKEIAVKRILRVNISDPRISSPEVECMLQTNHENIIRYICTKWDKNFV